MTQSARTLIRTSSTPYTLRSFNAGPGDLIAGAKLPEDPKAVHGHMFEPDTQLLVW